MHASYTRPPNQYQYQYRPDIDGLRAVAVLSVVAFHAFPAAMPGGFIGVDVFFVISGFLISTIIFGDIDKGRFRLSEFYARRIRRIFPSLLLVLTASLVFGHFVLLPTEQTELGAHVAAGAAFVANLILWREAGYFDVSADTKPLLHLWSLGIEEQFYIVWPLLIWLFRKNKASILILAVGMTLVSFGANIFGVERDSVATFYSLTTRSWELLCGSILAWFTHYRIFCVDTGTSKVDRWLASLCGTGIDTDGRMLANTLSVFGLLLLAYGFWNIDKDLSFPGYWALIPVTSAVLLISAGNKAWFNEVIPANKYVAWFGLISFPLYLWHWPLLSFARIHKDGDLSVETKIATIVLSISLAFLTYRFVERPIRHTSAGKLRTPLLSACMLALFCTGLTSAYIANEIAGRHPFLQDLKQNISHHRQSYREGTCFLRPEQDFTQFKDCGDTVSADKKTIFLWGDSHAAHLYPGYRRRYSETHHVAQLTSSACPPILGIDIKTRSNCRANNDYIFQSLASLPTTRDVRVVLSARWALYDLSKLEETIARVKSLGIKNIDLIGPVPEWKHPLPRLLVRYSLSQPAQSAPSRMSFGLTDRFFVLDAELRARTQALGINYISARDIFCDANGCLTKLNDETGSVTAWDNGHLTQESSEYLVSKFPHFED